MSGRRDFLGFTAGAVVARTVLPIAAKAEEVVTMPTPVHPDADLLDLAAMFIKHERAMQEWPCDALPGTPEDERQYAEQSRMVDIQHSLTLQLGLLRASTSDGIQARARCLAVHNADGAFSMDDPNTTTGRLLRHLMRDAGALGGAASDQPVTSPDAELLEACAASDGLERDYIAIGGAQPVNSPEEAAAEVARDRIRDEQKPLVARMVELRAITREGLAARARSLALWDAELMKDGTGDTGQCLTYAIVRDLIG